MKEREPPIPESPEVTVNKPTNPKLNRQVKRVAGTLHFCVFVAADLSQLFL